MWNLWLQKKGMTTNFFFTNVFYCCFWIRNPRWVKIRIRDKQPGSATLHTGSRIQQLLQKGRGEKFVVLPYFVATKVTKIRLIYFCTDKEKICANLLRIMDAFYPEKPIPDPGVKKAPWIRNTVSKVHWLRVELFLFFKLCHMFYASLILLLSTVLHFTHVISEKKITKFTFTTIFFISGSKHRIGTSSVTNVEK